MDNLVTAEELKQRTIQRHIEPHYLKMLTLLSNVGWAMSLPDSDLVWMLPESWGIESPDGNGFTATVFGLKVVSAAIDEPMLAIRAK